MNVIGVQRGKPMEPEVVGKSLCRIGDFSWSLKGIKVRGTMNESIEPGLSVWYL